ncbi:MAG: ectoine/hydroxyectoine ABC transporter ATP-binding protein EhuA, partial [Actinobacteria bacterium]|nr:ectoine/hydroxyectoine ABC transporter ATP-binding protein EhuA [Actinomycetota bacterium]
MSPRVGLEVCDIRAGYSGQRQVLDGVSLSVARGEVGVVLGPS